jgi:hypothetical protein
MHTVLVNVHSTSRRVGNGLVREACEEARANVVVGELIRGSRSLTRKRQCEERSGGGGEMHVVGGMGETIARRRCLLSAASEVGAATRAVDDMANFGAAVCNRYFRIEHGRS